MAQSQHKREYDRAWKSRNKIRLAAQANARYHANPAKQAKANGTYRAARPGRNAAASRGWRLSNPGKIKSWVAANLPRFAAAAMKRYASQFRATPVWASTEKINDWYEARAAAEELFEVRVQVDHIVPLKSDVVCGLHCEQNMQLLLAVVNASKSNRVWPDMWR
jgi:hypothetical protein